MANWGNFTLERIRRLEEEVQKNTDLLIQVKSFPHQLRVKRRYLTIQTVPIKGGNDVMIWDHETFGKWDDFKWGGTAFDPAVTQRLIWPRRVVTENFIDTDFEGASCTIWNLTAEKPTREVRNGYEVRIID